jgi:hypothetical protein
MYNNYSWRRRQLFGSWFPTLASTGIFLYASVYAHFRINCSCISPSSALYYRRANGTSLPDVGKRAWFRKSRLRINLLMQNLSFCTITAGFPEMLNAYLLFSHAVVKFKHMFRK